MMAVRSPQELIELYWDEVWNKGNVELIRELCADPIVRHDPGKVTLLSHDQQIERVRGRVEKIKPQFTHEILTADDRHVTSVWNMTAQSEKVPFMCGIETFRAKDGRFTDCWNPPYGYALWGEVE